jgi:hypothetical protein
MMHKGYIKASEAILNRIKCNDNIEKDLYVINLNMYKYECVYVFKNIHT